MKKWVLLVISLFWSSIMVAHVSSQSSAQLIQGAKEDAYQLSIPLLIAAQSGDQQNYVLARDKMEVPMQQLAKENPSKAAWLYGRMALAAEYMNDTASNAKTRLKALLTKANDDEFTAWAYGYAASLSKADYDEYKSVMLALADKLKTSPANQAWVYVMILQAAAVGHDADTYTAVKKRLYQLSQKDNLEAALNALIPKEDFLQWSSAIAYKAAIAFDDTTNAQLLKDALEKALQNKSGDVTDLMLAEVIFQPSTSLPRPKL